MEKYGVKSEILLDQQVIRIIRIIIENTFRWWWWLSLNKTLQFYNIIIVVRSVFHEGNKY